MALVETGTRALMGAVFGPGTEGETGQARELPPLLDKTMPLLMDRGFDGGEFLAAAAATGAQFLVRLTSTRSPAVLRHLPDGSFLSVIGGVKVRIITAAVTVTCTLVPPPVPAGGAGGGQVPARCLRGAGRDGGLRRGSRRAGCTPGRCAPARRCVIPAHRA
jgi:hypothetical protein